ncbi:hypothetical protein DPMN_121732 [Dreissena polymorpha]|uniref:Uncharacterized protein n=1 Tax=Dreissena polymorpha TaxID=45954 RepID=A0A9D4GQL7_DREPO|nr:hypothetical protein DPMN_121732 [Dreissena polymorpha]
MGDDSGPPVSTSYMTSYTSIASMASNTAATVVKSATLLRISQNCKNVGYSESITVCTTLSIMYRRSTGFL